MCESDGFLQLPLFYYVTGGERWIQARGLWPHDMLQFSYLFYHMYICQIIVNKIYKIPSLPCNKQTIATRAVYKLFVVFLWRTINSRCHGHCHGALVHLCKSQALLRDISSTIGKVMCRSHCSRICCLFHRRMFPAYCYSSTYVLLLPSFSAPPQWRQ